MKLPAPPLKTSLLDNWSALDRVWARWFDSVFVHVTGRQGITATTGVVAGGARAQINLTWPIPYGDSNYTVVASVLDTSAAGTGLRVERVRVKTATGITVQVINDSGGNLTGTVHAIAIHDS